MKRLSQIALLLAISAAAFTPKGQAREITFLFTGTVRSIETKDVDDLPNYVAIGDPLVGTFTFESDAVGDFSNPPGVMYPAITAREFTVGHLAGTYTPGPPWARFIWVYDNNKGVDTYSASFPFALTPEISDPIHYSASQRDLAR